MHASPQSRIAALSLCLLCALAGPARAQQVSPVLAGEAEAQKCEDRIAAVQRDIVSKYGDSLGELQLQFQKAADLEGALAVRTERQRLQQEGTLTEQALAAEPKALRALQQQYVTKQQELVAQVVSESVPKLLELKRSLTVAGRLDDAVAVRGLIERVQSSHAPVTRPAAGSVVPADVVLMAYAADRARADQTYKGQRIVVRGVVGGYRQDPNDAKHFLVYLTGNTGNWIQCAFAVNDFRFREEKQFNNTFLIITPKGDENASVRVQKGQQMDIRGQCDGWDEAVKLVKCDFGSGK